MVTMVLNRNTKFLTFSSSKNLFIKLSLYYNKTLSTVSTQKVVMGMRLGGWVVFVQKGPPSLYNPPDQGPVSHKLHLERTIKTVICHK